MHFHEDLKIIHLPVSRCGQRLTVSWKVKCVIMSFQSTGFFTCIQAFSGSPVTIWMVQQNCRSEHLVHLSGFCYSIKFWKTTKTLWRASFPHARITAHCLIGSAAQVHGDARGHWAPHPVIQSGNLLTLWNCSFRLMQMIWGKDAGSHCSNIPLSRKKILFFSEVTIK